MVVFGKGTIYKTFIEEKKPIEIGVQVIEATNVNGEEKTFFYQCNKELLKIEDLSQDLALRDRANLREYIQTRLDSMVKKVINKINNQRMIFAQHKGIKSERIINVQGYVDLVL